MLNWLSGYRWRTSLGPDLIAGVVLSALLIPESLGYAGVAGLPPEVGLFAAPFALIGYAVYGGGRVIVVAAASAVSAVSANAVAPLAADAATFVAVSALLALVSGVIYVVTGALRLGWIANFMSRPVIDGFIIGLALFIIAGQLGDLVGVASEGESAVAKFIDVFAGIAEWDVLTMVIGVAGLAALFAIHRFAPRVPGALVVMGAAMVATALFELEANGVEVVGNLPTGLPALGLPSLEGISLGSLIPGALAVTLVGFSEGFAAVKSYAAKDKQAVGADRELVAFGISNIGAGLSSGMVVGGSLSKTAASESAGARTQMANVVAALMVVAALLFLGPVFAFLPEAVLASVVIHAVWGLVKVEQLVALRKIHRFDFSMALAVLVGTLVLEPIYAVVLGVVVSLIYVIYRVSFPYRTSLGIDPDGSNRPVDLATHPGASAVPGVLIYRMDAPLLYANATSFKDGLSEYIENSPDPVNAVVIDGESMFTIDSTGVESLKETIEQLLADGVEVRLARVRSGVVDIMRLAGVFDSLSEDRVVPRVEDAIVSIRGS